MQKEFFFDNAGVLYPVIVTFRRTSRLSLRVAKDGKTLRVSAPFLMRFDMAAIKEFVERAAPKLLSRVQGKEPDYHDGWLYVFGEMQEVGELDEKQIDACLKKRCLPSLTERVRYYEGLMGIKTPYNVRLRKMTSRYGVNSAKTHSLTFTTRLMCCSWDIIDALIVHELAHHFQRNHQRKFYEIVYRYDPDYDTSHAKLRKGIHR